MKRLKVNAMAIVAVVAAAGTVAFRAPVSNEWVFTGTSQSQIRQADHYSLTAPKPQGCDPTMTLPCSIVVDAADEEALQDFLDPLTDAQIKSQATGLRN